MGFEPTITVFEGAKTVRALDRAATIQITAGDKHRLAKPPQNKRQIWNCSALMDFTKSEKWKIIQNVPWIHPRSRSSGILTTLMTFVLVSQYVKLQRPRKPAQIILLTADAKG
jgi:hypothetical protein